MPGICNYNNVSEQIGFPLIPEGEYIFEIIIVEEAKTQNGDPMINIVLSCQDQNYFGNIVYERIIIPVDENAPAGKIAGRTKHFLHCIGEPYEGQFEWDENNWLWKKVLCSVSQNEYKGKKKNIIKSYILQENKGVEQKKVTPPNIAKDNKDYTSEMPF